METCDVFWFGAAVVDHRHLSNSDKTIFFTTSGTSINIITCQIFARVKVKNLMNTLVGIDARYSIYRS